MEHVKTKLTLLVATLLLSNCGTFKVRDKNQAEVDSIKSAAVVAMSVIEPVPKSLSLDIGGGGVSGDSNGGKIQGHDAHIESMWQELQRSVSLQLKWKTLDKTSMISKSGYKAVHDQTMKGWQNKMPPGENKVQYNPTDIMDSDAIRIMGQSGRDKLLTDLNVDALVVARIDVQLSGTSIMGFGPMHPKAVLNLSVYKKGFEAPVWFDGNIQGKEMPSVGATALFSKEKLQSYALESAKDAFAKINKNEVKK